MSRLHPERALAIRPIRQEPLSQHFLEQLREQPATSALKEQAQRALRVPVKETVELQRPAERRERLALRAQARWLLRQPWQLKEPTEATRGLQWVPDRQQARVVWQEAGRAALKVSERPVRRVPGK